MSRTLLLFVLLLTTPAIAQKPKKTDALHDFSNSLEKLALTVNRGVVKIVSTGYSQGSDDDESSGAAWAQASS